MHELVRARTALDPTLLLDDVFSELDPARSRALVAELPAGQSILTTAAPLPEGIAVTRIAPGGEPVGSVTAAIARRARAGSGESMPKLLGRLGAPSSPVTMEVVFTRWAELVGAELAEHVRPLRVDGHALVVAVDHPAWATRARMESEPILARVRALGETSLERLEVVVERP